MTGPGQALTGQRHISIVSETFPPEVNGAANTLKYLCAELVRRGHFVSVIRPTQRHEAIRNTSSDEPFLCHQTHLVAGISLPGCSSTRFGISSAGRLARLWKSQKPDVIYVATQGPLGVCAINAARKLSIPVSSGLQSNIHRYSQHYWGGWLGALLRRYGQWLHNRTALTLVPTRKTIAMTDRLGITRTAVWSRGVDCSLFSPAKRSKSLRAYWGLGPDDPAVLYVGRLAQEKNIQLAVSCFERLKSLHPTAKFVLVGSGPLAKRLAERHPDYILAGMLRGEPLAEHFASGDLFLFPSKTDTFGNVVTEAMASGLAVVAFDDAAAHEHIRHGDNGMKAGLEDSEAFVSHALRLVDQPTFAGRIRAQARLDALDLDWASQADRFESLVINQPMSARRHVGHNRRITPV